MSVKQRALTLASSPLTWAGILAGVLYVSMCNDSGPVLDPRLQHSLDSLQGLRRQDEARLDSMQRVATAYERMASDASTQARIAQRASEAPRRRADSLATRAQAQPDSAAAHWHFAYVARTEEADSLRSALTAEQHAGELLRSSVTELRLAYDRSEARRLALESLNQSLAGAVRDAGRCRIAGLVPCPSRTQAFIAGSVLGAGAIIYARS